MEARHPGQRTGDVMKKSSRFGSPRWVDKHYSEVCKRYSCLQVTTATGLYKSTIKYSKFCINIVF